MSWTERLTDLGCAGQPLERKASQGTKKYSLHAMLSIAVLHHLNKVKLGFVIPIKQIAYKHLIPQNWGIYMTE